MRRMRLTSHCPSHSKNIPMIWQHSIGSSHGRQLECPRFMDDPFHHSPASVEMQQVRQKDVVLYTEYPVPLILLVISARLSSHSIACFFLSFANRWCLSQRQDAIDPSLSFSRNNVLNAVIRRVSNALELYNISPWVPSYCSSTLSPLPSSLVLLYHHLLRRGRMHVVLSITPAMPASPRARHRYLVLVVQHPMVSSAVVIPA